MEEEQNKIVFGNNNIQAVHFVGIGGTGMSALAEIALDAGWVVSGSDINLNNATLRLSRRGARIFAGHDKSHIRGADLVVYSSAIKEDNPELRLARREGVKINHRSDFLGSLMKLKQSIAVAGSHGKTSTGAMIAWVLREERLDPAFALGGELINLGTNGRWGQGDFLVAEADESDGSFRKLASTWEIITGIDLDHVNYYPGWDSLKAAFSQFMLQLRENGCLITYSDDRVLGEIIPAGVKNLTFGVGEEALIRAENIELGKGGSRFRVVKGQRPLGEIRLQLWGVLNVINALAAVTLGIELGIPFSRLAQSLINYRGVRRRLEVKSCGGDILVVEDYAHHPAEVVAALEAVRSAHPRRIWCLFQPHRYSRLNYFARSLASALFPCDHVILTGVYHAFEKPRAGVDSALILAELKNRGHEDARLLEKSKIIDRVFPELREGDAVVVMGAGDIGELADQLVEKIEKESDDGSD